MADTIRLSMVFGLLQGVHLASGMSVTAGHWMWKGSRRVILPIGRGLYMYTRRRRRMCGTVIYRVILMCRRAVAVLPGRMTIARPMMMARQARPGVLILILCLVGVGDGMMGIIGWTGITVTMVRVGPAGGRTGGSGDFLGCTGGMAQRIRWVFCDRRRSGRRVMRRGGRWATRPGG